jgi:hypothetical protein
MRQRPTLSKRTFIATAFAILLLPQMASAATVTIAWDRNPEPDIAGYRISYGTVSGVYTNTVDVGNRLDYQIRGVDDGQKYYFVVRAYNTGGAVSPPSSEISANIVGLTALATDMVSPTPTGKPITWTALAGPGAQLQYQFWRYSQSSGAWSLGQDYSTSNSFTWTPGAEGTYAVQVWARKVASTENFEAWRSTGLFNVANRPITVGSLEADVALPPSHGTTMTWTARATGGPLPLQYQFWRYDAPTGQWVLGRDYGTSNTYSWTLGAADLGQHILQVWVRGAGSSANFDAYRSTSFEVRNAPVSVGSLTANKTFPAGTGDPITWQAVAAGPGPLEYSFYLFSHSSNTWTVAPRGPSSSYTWTPSSAGNYWLQVWVRRQGSTAPYEAYKGTDVFQISDGVPVIRALTSDKAAPFGTEAPVTFKVDATGGPGALQYSFLLYSQARDSWSLVRLYGPSNTFTWTPSLGDQGDYVVQAWVRRPSSTASYEAWAATGTFTVGNPTPTVQGVTINVGSATTVGTPLSVVARASGGPGPLEYRFLRYSLSTQAWTIVQEYSWDNSFAWVPGPLDRGLHTFQVWVRRGGSSAAFEGFGSSQLLQVN